MPFSPGRPARFPPRPVDCRGAADPRNGGMSRETVKRGQGLNAGEFPPLPSPPPSQVPEGSPAQPGAVYPFCGGTRGGRRGSPQLPLPAISMQMAWRLIGLDGGAFSGFSPSWAGSSCLAFSGRRIYAHQLPPGRRGRTQRSRCQRVQI